MVLCTHHRHYEKIDQWKAILSDLQQPGGSGGGGVGGGGVPMAPGMPANMGMVATGQQQQQIGPNGLPTMGAGPSGSGPMGMAGGGPSGMPAMQVNGRTRTPRVS